MKLSNMILLCFAYTSNAYLLPDLPDGLYSIKLDKKGLAVGEPKLLSAKRMEITLERRAELEARLLIPSPQTGCHGHNLNGPSIDSLQNHWSCNGKWAEAGDVIVSYHFNYNILEGEAVFMCSYSSNPCSDAEFQEAMFLIGTQCSWYGGGWVWIPSWNKTYGRAASGQNICI